MNGATGEDQKHNVVAEHDVSSRGEEPLITAPSAAESSVESRKRTIDEVDGSDQANGSEKSLSVKTTESADKANVGPGTAEAATKDKENVDNNETSTAAAGEGDEEGEEDDDDDEDDDDVDDDVETTRKKQRRERNRFLDIEAEVSEDEDDDEDEEDSELIREGFITRGDEEDEDRGARVDDRLHRELDQNLRKTADEDMHKIAQDFKERYGRDSSKDYRVQTQGGYVPQRFMLPSVDTAIIWSVRCRPGKEKELVKKLLNKKFNLDKSMGSKKLKILSIFQRDNYTGRIYIEAPKQSVIEKFVNGVPDIYANQKLLIPVQELPLLLKPTKSDEVRLDIGSYVRIKRGIYKGDLAVVDQISQNNLEASFEMFRFFEQIATVRSPFSNKCGSKCKILVILDFGLWYIQEFPNGTIVSFPVSVRLT